MKRDVVVCNPVARPRLLPHNALGLAVLAAITCSFGLQALRAQEAQDTPADSTAPATTEAAPAAPPENEPAANTAPATTGTAPTVVAPAPAPLSEESKLQQQTEHYNNGLAALKNNSLESAADHFQKNAGHCARRCDGAHVVGLCSIEAGKV
jgi:TolA-binding protein